MTRLELGQSPAECGKSLPHIPCRHHLVAQAHADAIVNEAPIEVLAEINAGDFSNGFKSK